MMRASVTNCAVIAALMNQRTTRRENRSMTAATYSKPSAVQTYVKSAIHLRLGADASKVRSSTFGATAPACRSPRSDGRRRRRGRALRACTRINRSIRCRPERALSISKQRNPLSSCIDYGGSMDNDRACDPALCQNPFDALWQQLGELCLDHLASIVSWHLLKEENAFGDLVAREIGATVLDELALSDLGLLDDKSGDFLTHFSGRPADHR